MGCRSSARVRRCNLRSRIKRLDAHLRHLTVYAADRCLATASASRGDDDLSNQRAEILTTKHGHKGRETAISLAQNMARHTVDCCTRDGRDKLSYLGAFLSKEIHRHPESRLSDS